MYKIFTLLFLLFALDGAIYAQQDAQYTQYMFNGQTFNPAYSGSRGKLSMAAVYRNQWLNTAAAPQTYSLGIHALLGNNHGIGLYAENDQIGVHKRLSAYLSYAFHIGFSESLKLSIGLQGGMLQYKSDWLDSPPKDLTDLVFLENESYLAPNFGVGLYLYSPNFYVGFSAPHLLDSSLDNSIEALSKYERQYVMTAGVVIPIGEMIKLKPSVLVRSIPSVAFGNTQADVNLSLFYNNALMIGLGYRTSKAIAGLLHYQFKNGLRLGYAYDYSLNELADYHSGSHEVMIGFDISSAGDKLEKVLHPRFF